jgi:hypothetical protein
MLLCMVARKNPQSSRPFDFTDRFYAEVKRNDAVRRAHELQKSGDLAGGRKALREATQFERQLQTLNRAQQRAQAEQQRDSFARKGIELSEAGKIAEARKAAKEAERWDREAKRLGRP